MKGCDHISVPSNWGCDFGDYLIWDGNTDVDLKHGDLVVGMEITETPGECRQLCEENEECQGFGHYGNNKHRNCHMMSQIHFFKSPNGGKVTFGMICDAPAIEVSIGIAMEVKNSVGVEF